MAVRRCSIEAEFGSWPIGIFVRTAGSFRTRSKLEEESWRKRWPLILSAKRDGCRGRQVTKRPTTRFEELCHHRPIDRNRGRYDGIHGRCPSGVHGSILSLGVAMRMASPSWGWLVRVRGCSAWARTGTEGCFDGDIRRENGLGIAFVGRVGWGV